MKYAICLQPYIPMRSKPEESSEMVNQMLFGDTFQILEEQPRWYYIVRDYDGYHGWIDWKTATVLSPMEYNQYVANSTDALLLRLPYNPIQKTFNGQSGASHLSWGSRIFNLDETGITFKMQGIRFDVPNMTYVNPMKASGMSRRACSKYILQQAQLLLNVPYLWGGISAFGLDCSGFTQTLFRFIGITLPRDASQQYEMGTPVAFDEAEPGDLAFFGNDGKVSHVGVVAENGRVLHVSGYLHFDKLQPEGIWNEQLQDYSHYTIGIRRFF